MQTSSSKPMAIVVAGLLLVAAGKPAPEFQPSYPASPPAPAANGSIFQARNGYAPLTSGTRAASVGDILTVVLVERTRAAKASVASTSRSAEIGLTPPLKGPLSLFAPEEFTIGGDNDFDGKGQAAQSNSLSGEISVTVAQVFPNGTMLVRGQKRIRLNRGDEFVQLSGLVRQSDVNSDNRVPSTRIADANIIYSGTGEIARASRQGWLQRFFSIVSPF